MVDHEIAHQVVFCRNPLHILPGAELGIHLLIAQRREATVRRGREERQNMNAADRSGKVPVQNAVEVLQIVSHGIGIGDQHNLVAQFLFHFTMAPLRVMSSGIARLFRVPSGIPARKENAGSSILSQVSMSWFPF